MVDVIELLLVGFGGIFGAIARYLVGRVLDSVVRTTVFVNVVGSLCLGGLVGAAVGDPFLLALGVGFCGAFTTFATFAVETVRLLENGRQRLAVGYAIGMAALAIGAIFLGGAMGTALG